jgi:hypothetical protein
MPIKPSASRGSIPYSSSRWLAIVSTISSTHIRPSISPISASPSLRWVAGAEERSMRGT